jgi:glutamyl-tRNA reductase
MILLLSLSFKNTPQKVREYFAFGREDKERLLTLLCEEKEIDEAVVLVTCNRTEIYVSTESKNATGSVINIILEKCEAIVERSIEHLRDYVFCYTEKGAVTHLYKVSAGLDSMLIGEDQILGQVKEAIEFARDCNSVHLYLNTLFRDAITQAKKIKTETMISKSGVSTATLALRAAKDVLSSFEGKNVLLIGASGKIGNIVLKNALSYDFSHIYVTKRSHNIDMSPNVMDRISIIEYDDRYHYIEQADVIISATSGPHFTLTREHILKNSLSVDQKVFIDLAVPCDIDNRIRNLKGVYYYDMEDMKKFADENNEKKKLSIERAKVMAEEGVEKFLKWALFQKNLEVFSSAVESLEEEIKRIGEKKTLEHLFYKIRDNGSLEALQSIIDIFQCN